MRFLAFADVLGNPHAAQAILLAAKKLDEAAAKRDADASDGASRVEVVCLGNAMGPGPDVALTIERLRKAHVHLVRGPRDAAALGMPGPPELRLEGKALLAKLAAPEAAYLRQATPPRRLVANGKRILLTSETAPDRGAADVVLRPGPRPLVRRDGAVLDVATGNASHAPDGESPYVVYDAEKDEARVHYAAWDRTLLRRLRAG